MIRSLIVVSILAVCSDTFAQTPNPETPKRFLGFFKRGMNIGVRPYSDTSDVIVYTYSDSNFKLAQEIASHGVRTLDAKDFARQHELVRVALGRYLDRFVSADSSEDEILLMPLGRTSLGKLIAVGTDYLLCEIDGTASKRVVIPKSSIAKIYLDASPIRFHSRRSRSGTSTGG